MIDMHAHLSAFSEEEIFIRIKRGIFTCFSAGTIEEWERYRKLQRPGFALSFGIHPWYSDLYEGRLKGSSLSELASAECYRECAYIGEIGLDSVWTKVPLSVQRAVFNRQLEIAAKLHKPVLLHTKGQEAEVAEMIKDFPEKVCVHWYSGGEKDLEAYFARDCYFTLGPDTAELCAREKVAQAQSCSDVRTRMRILAETPLESLFVETDGIEAIAWAKAGRQKPTEDVSVKDVERIPKVLEDSVRAVSYHRGIPEQKVILQMRENYAQFISDQKVV